MRNKSTRKPPADGKSYGIAQQINSCEKKLFSAKIMSISTPNFFGINIRGFEKGLAGSGLATNSAQNTVRIVPQNCVLLLTRGPRKKVQKRELESMLWEGFRRANPSVHQPLFETNFRAHGIRTHCALSFCHLQKKPWQSNSEALTVLLQFGAATCFRLTFIVDLFADIEKGNWNCSVCFGGKT